MLYVSFIICLFFRPISALIIPTPLSSFWFILKQQCTIDEISIFSNSSHLERRAELSDTILKGTYPGTIPARFGLISFSGFRGEDLNVIFYQNTQQNVCLICIICINWLKEQFHRKTRNIC